VVVEQHMSRPSAVGLQWGHGDDLSINLSINLSQAGDVMDLFIGAENFVDVAGDALPDSIGAEPLDGDTAQHRQTIQQSGKAREAM